MSFIPAFGAQPPAEEEMTLVTEPLVLDFQEWLAAKPRAHREVMDAWRTSCPQADGQPAIRLTPHGLDALKTAGRM